MYKNFFGLAKDPFIVSPDPSFLYSTPATDKTYARLLYGIQARKGLILLVGEVGTGKTLLLRKLMEQIQDEATETAFVFNPRMKAAEFLDYVLGDFGVENDPTDKLLTFRKLQDWLLKRNKQGKASVLIVDEAQNLTPEAFQVVHALSNLETPTEKLLQIVLSGQREVEATLRLPEPKPAEPAHCPALAHLSLERGRDPAIHRPPPARGGWKHPHHFYPGSGEGRGLVISGHSPAH